MLNTLKVFLQGLIDRYSLIFCSLTYCLLSVLPGYTQPVELTIPVGHPSTVMDFSSDGRFLVTGSSGNSFSIWDIRTCHMIRQVFVGTEVKQVLLLPNNKEVITVCGNGSPKHTLHKWDVYTGKLLATLPFTASPGIQLIPGTNYLFVPDYATKKNDSPDGFWETLQRMSKDGRFADSIEEVHNQVMDELVKRGEVDPDTSDPEKQLEIQKKYMELKINFITGKQGNIAIIDLATYKPIGVHPYTVQVAKLLTCQDTNYLLTVNDIPNTFKKDVVVGLWEINKLIAQSVQQAKRKPQKEWHVNTNIEHLAVAPGTGYFATCDENKTIQVWRVQQDAPLGKLAAKGRTVNGMSFSAAGTELYVYSGPSPEAYVEGWSTAGLSTVVSKALPSLYLSGEINVSPYDKFFLVPGNNGLVKFSLKGDSISQFRGRAGVVSQFGFTNNDQEVVIKYNQLPDFRSPEFIRFFKREIEDDARKAGKTLKKEEADRLLALQTGDINAIMSSPLARGFVFSWDLTGKGTKVVKQFSDTYKATSSNGQYKLVNDAYKKPGLPRAMLKEIIPDTIPEYEGQDPAEKELAKLFKNPANGFSQLIYLDSLPGPSLFFINTKTRDTITFISIDTTDWVILLKNGYYWSSRNGARRLGYTQGLDVYPFEQFDVQYNRPDLVLQAIGKANPQQLSGFKEFYLKRIEVMELDTSRFRRDFNVPVADFKNRNDIVYEQRTNKLGLAITAQDKKESLVRFNIWVNGTPVFGTQGKSIAAASSRQFDTLVDITLSRGVNRIETSVINANGVESYHLPLFVNCVMP